MRLQTRFFLLLLLAVAAAHGHEQLELDREFRAICERAKTGDNTYFSTRLLNELESQLRLATDPEQRAGFRGVLGRELLKQGQVERAIDELTTSLAEVRANDYNANLEASVHWHLALAHLSLAEDQNCVGHRTGASCIVPIQPDAVHPLPEHSRKAGALLLDYVNRHPRNVQAVWLLNLARRVSGDYPDGVPAQFRLSDAALGSTEPFAPWRDRAPELGINADDLAGGAVVDDFDGDGLLDLVSSTWDPCDHLKAFRNDGRGGFEDVTERWGLDHQLGGLNLIQADYDNDGRLDLLVLRGAWMLGEGKIRNSLLRNRLDDGETSFSDVTADAGLAQPAYATQTAAFADFDGDGDLDLYIGNEATGANPYPSAAHAQQRRRYLHRCRRAGWGGQSALHQGSHLGRLRQRRRPRPVRLQLRPQPSLSQRRSRCGRSATIRRRRAGAITDAPGA